MNTKPFTFRIPIDLLEAIESRMGESNRSGFIIQTLREALGIEAKQSSVDPRVTEQVSELLYQFEVFQTKVDLIASRVEKLEKVPESLVAETRAEYKTIGKTDSKTEEDAGSVATKAEIAETKEMAEIDLLELLNKEQPTKPWSKERLRNYRRDNASKRRHAVGSCGFTYKEKDGKIHKWSVWKENLLPIEPEDSIQTTAPAGPLEYDSQEFGQSFSSPHP